MTIATTARRLPIVAGGILVLLVAMWAGLLRLGWNWPGAPVMAMVYHGPLMVGGFLGTVISLERSVALGRWWTYAAPLASVSGAIALMLGVDPRIGQWLMLIASIVLVCVFIRLLSRHLTMFMIVMSIGAGLWLGGNIVWMHSSLVPRAVPWWIGFLVLTIVGERLELSRFLLQTPARLPTFLVAAGTYLAGIVAGLWLPGAGMALAGLGMVALAGWLFVFDLARRTVRQSGLTRYAAVCLLSGYGWLAIGGALSVLYTAIFPLLHGGAATWMQRAPGAGVAYDAILHSVLLGFVFVMIFGHAPIIFPSVLSVNIEYRPRFYVHWALLEASVLLRVSADLADWTTVRQWAGIFNVVAILIFLANTASTVRRRVLRPPAREIPSTSAGLVQLGMPGKR